MPVNVNATASRSASPRRRFTLGLGFALAAALSAGLATAASADVLLVPTDFPTIQAAINAAQTGDTVEVLPGTYAESIIINNQAITVEAASISPSSTVLTGDGGPTATVRIQNAGRGARFRGFSLREANGRAMDVRNSDVQIENLRIADNAGGVGVGMFVEGGAPAIRDVEFRNNTSTGGGSGIYLDGSAAIIERCEFERLTGGIPVFVFGGSPTFRNCRWEDNEAFTALRVNLAGATARLHGCTITAHLGAYALVAGDGAAIELVNSAIVDNDELTDGTLLANGAFDVVNTIVHGNPYELAFGGQVTARHSLIEGGWPGAGNIDADPDFRRRELGDFRLDPGSPCIDAGDTGAAAAVLQNDASGGPRFLNDANIPDTGIPAAPPMVDIGPEERDPTLRYVDGGAAAGGDGLSWATAMRSPQDALVDATGEVDEIWVAGGIYRPDDGTGDRSRSFTLRSGTRLYGGFGGGETRREERDPDAAVTVLTGNIGDPASVADDAYHVLRGEDISSAVLDGFRITRGAATGIGGDADGGGLWLRGASVTVRNCRFIFSRAAGEGTAIYADDNSSVSVEAGRFLNDVATGGSDAGGVVVMRSGSLTMHSCIVNGAQTGGSPAVLSTAGGFVSLINCTVVHNLGAEASGGVGASEGSTILVHNSIIWQNDAAAPNSASEVQLIFDDSSQVFATASVVEDFDPEGIQSPVAVTDRDPRFVDQLGADGIPGTPDDDLRLSQFSCQIDQGYAAFVPPGPVIDVDGGPRRLDDIGTADGPFAGDPPVDIGAHEFAGIGCRTDLNGSGATEFTDLLAVLGAWGSCGACQADINCSGAVDFVDVLEILSQWGPCPTA